jgi:hypothetical protein
LKRRQEKEVTFLKKSNQKTFGPAGFGAVVATPHRTESLFASFSSEKEVLAFYMHPNINQSCSTRPSP